jgi:hypothetical protein
MAQTWGQTATRRALKPVIGRLDQHINRLARSRARQVNDETRIDVRQLRAEVAELRSELTAARDQLGPLGYSVELLLGPDGRAKSRVVDDALITLLAGQVQQATGLDDARAPVVQAYRLLFELELRGVGRLAGGVKNVLGKLATTPLLAPPNGDILEIGTLYGIFAGGMARQLNRIGLDPRITIVDPFAGGQLQRGKVRADASGSPVTEVVARANLELAGVTGDRIRVVPGYSADPAIQESIADRRYGVMIIDGDHSAEGVSADLKLAEKLVAERGIVVIDDYGDRKWAGVKQATTDYLAGATRLELVGVVATSAFLRARPAENP